MATQTQPKEKLEATSSHPVLVTGCYLLNSVAAKE